MNKTLRNGLFGALLLVGGYFLGQPAMIATGLQKVVETAQEVSDGSSKGNIDYHEGE